jgi:imidazoleglycerol-phosphate dehydratase
MTGRMAKLERNTRETQVVAELNLNGTGEFRVECEIQFLKHMVETMARYASFDLKMNAGGDNDHHIIEDVAITLGTVTKMCLGEEPVERVATEFVPMDDALVMVSLDIVDRPYADVDCPDPIYAHFFRSFAMAAGLTLHIDVIRGFDEHHIVEASFKALGKALHRATRVRGSELSTKDRVEVR